MTYPRFVVTDLETTGHAAKKGDRMIQASFVVIENKKIVNQYTTFLNPERSIPVFIEELTGISEDMVRDAPLFHEVAPNILPLLDGAVFVAHNVSFDLKFLQAELEEAGYRPFRGPTIDTVELAKILMPTSDSYKLGELTQMLGFAHDRPHQADSDAYVTAELLIYLMDKMSELPMATLEKLEELSRHLKSDILYLIESVISEKKHNIEELPEHIEIYRGIGLRKKQAVKRVIEKGVPEYPVSALDKQALISGLPSFDYRESQFQMMDEVNRSLEDNEHFVIEAGTGTGKSLGYLLPAVFYAKKQQKPVIVSTYTIVLQQQLLQKEIGQLKKMVPFSVSAVMLKGRNHYLDLFKFMQSLMETDDNYDFVLAKMQILIWLLETETGDVDEINLSSGGWLFWNHVKQDGDYLNKGRKAWIDKDFYLHAKKQAKEADIVITNHSLLVAGLTSSSSILPDYTHVIIDEAHHFETAARNRLGQEIDQLSFKFLLGRIGTFTQEQLFYHSEQLLKKYDEQESGKHTITDRMINELLVEADEWFQVMQTFFEFHTKRKAGNWHRRELRIGQDQREMKYWNEVEYGAERVYMRLTEVIKGLKTRVQNLVPYREQMAAKEQMKMDELVHSVQELEGWRDGLELTVFRPEEDSVVWLEADIRSFANTFTLKAQPIEPAELIKENLLMHKTVIFTSATLTVNRSFAFFTEQIGLGSMKYKELLLASPFDFKNNCRMVIPSDLPEIKKVKADEYIESVANQLIAVAEATKGRMLVLFTAYDMLKKTHDLMKDSGLLDDYILMAQGITSGSQARLTRNFQIFDKAILFGTNSFWEGIDIPGEDLSCLVIVRLPFSPPDDPFVQAKSEKLIKEGKNPFSVYALPQAILRFKQGFGRLIRSSRDRGVILVFDRRIQTTSYGRAFIQSIPGIDVQETPLDETVAFIQEWL
ncbi:ATP-dependent DNA helicase DinG [Bacillus ectoiniformans]|uniref:ATP-dependent DNA helicase DinG n=1 Tax=Bacillus ectoiniformans TaxID=1494429 RepID=UPI00195CBE22|nr:ATP-dependent DNA helicase DinG [Bacillus ectoiniformans]MBM7647965.1 ATP-dependent DNA helicase DinG [Bacillus ectoiniformans]